MGLESGNTTSHPTTDTYLSEAFTSQRRSFLTSWPLFPSTLCIGMIPTHVSLAFPRGEEVLMHQVVDGCSDRSNDPGALQIDWLEVQLSEFRDRGMQVWLSGHVPPHMGHYYPNCCKHISLVTRLYLMS
jgi:hypothetical protein